MNDLMIRMVCLRKKGASKKAQMTTFLVTTILGVMVFLFLIGVGWRLLNRTSVQAQDNFFEFVESLRDFSEEKHTVGFKQGFVLIQDEQTAIVHFEKTGNSFMQMNYWGFIPDMSIEIIRPAKCDVGVECICLFDDLSHERENTAFTLVGDSVICVEVSFDVQMSSCSIGLPRNIDSISYECESGFILERNLPTQFSYWDELIRQIGGEPSSSIPYLHSERRRGFIFEQGEDSVILVPQDAYSYEGDSS